MCGFISLGNSDGETGWIQEPLTLRKQQTQDGQQVWPVYDAVLGFACLQMQDGDGGENHGSKTKLFSLCA